MALAVWSITSDCRSQRNMDRCCIQPKIHTKYCLLGIYWTFLDLMWIGIVPNMTILFVHVLIHPDMGLIAEDKFSMKITVNC